MSIKGPYLHIPRRRFLIGAGASALILPFARNTALAESSSSTLFTLGVASGDPASTSVVLWTRIAPDPLALDGGNASESINVRWQVATDPTMRHIVKQGFTQARAVHGHNIRILVTELPTNSTLYYQFSALGENSAVGRTRTFPFRFVDPGEMKFALTSCQNYQSGYFGAWQDVVEQDVDFVLQCGDYIYENGPTSDPEAPRLHVGSEIKTIEEYRRRYAQYRLDPNLRAAHQAAPFIVTTDDHEVDNNYAALVPENDQTLMEFIQRRSQAYRAYFEVMPIRTGISSFTSTQEGDPVPIGRRLYRNLNFGSLASITVLDTRQYRDDQPCNDGLKVCPEAADPMRTMLGQAQESFLVRQLHRSGARWRIIEQQVMFMEWDLGELLNTEELFNMDAWDGYSAQRNFLLKVFADLPSSNNVVLTGDIHASYAADLRQDFSNPDSPIVGAEFVCPGVSSTFGDLLAVLASGSLPSNPHIRYFNGFKRGYALCTVTNSQWRTDFRLVDNNLIEDPTIQTGASWVINDSEPGLMEVASNH